MKIVFLWAFIGLCSVAVTSGREYKGFRSAEETATDATLVTSSTPATASEPSTADDTATEAASTPETSATSATSGSTAGAIATTEAPPVNVSSQLANYDGLNLIYNADEKTIGFVNVTENVGFSSTQQGSSLTIVLVDSKTGQVLSYKSLNRVLLAKNGELKGDVSKSLDLILDNYVFKNEPVSNSLETDRSSGDALTLWSEVYLHLGHPKEKGSKDYNSLRYLQVFSQKLQHLYFGPLKGLIVGKSPFPLKQNLNRFLTISVGLQELFGRATGGLKNILSRNVVFEVNSLFNGKNGAEVLVYVLRQTGAKFDLSTLWGNILTNVEELLDIIGKLGGGESKNGVDETFALIGHFWAAAHFRIPVTNFIQFLFESSTEDHWSQADDGDFKQVLKDAKNITDEQSKKYDNLVKLSGFVKFFTNLTTNSLIENNVNISDLVEKWRKRDAVGGLKTITDLTLKLFSPDKYGRLLFDSFTAFLNATSDPDSLKKLIPGVSLEDFPGGGGSILSALNNTHKIDEQLKKGGDPTQILNGIPIFNEFSKIYQNSFGKNFDFSKALNGGTFSDYLSKLPLASPLRKGFDAFSHFFQQPANVFKQIFLDPIKNFFPGLPGLPNQPLSPNSPPIPNIPFLPQALLSAAQTSTAQESTHTTEAEIPTNFEDASEKLTTSSVQQTHLTVSTSSPTEDSEITKITGVSEDISESTTEKKSDESEKHSETISTTDIVDYSTEESVEFKNHHNRILNENHKERHHHNNKKHFTHNDKHNHYGKDHDNKHHVKSHQRHQEKHHQNKDHHHRRHQDGENHQNKHQNKIHKDHKHEEERHQRVLLSHQSEKYHGRKHQKENAQT